MAFVLAVLQKELQVRRRDPVSLLLWLLIPLAIGGLIMAFAGSGSGPRPVAKLLIADNDNSQISALVSTAFQRDQLADLVEADNVTELRGRALIDEGEASALLIIPDGFGAAVIADTPVTVQLITNPSQRISPRLIEESLGLMVDAVFYIQRIFGPEIQQITQQLDLETAPSNELIAAVAIAVNEKMTAIGRYLSPPAIAVEARAPEGTEQAGPEPSLGLLYFPGIVLMTLLFLAQVASDDLWQEREQQTLSRVAAAPQPLRYILAGKVAAFAVISGIAVLVLFAPGFAYFGLDISLVPASLVFSMVSGSVLFLLLAIIQLFSPSRRAGSILGTISIFPLMIMGGSFYPVEAMPDWMSAIGRMTPNGYMAEVLKQQFIGAGTFGDIALAAGILAAIALVLMGIASWRLERHFVRER